MYAPRPTGNDYDLRVSQRFFFPRPWSKRKVAYVSRGEPGGCEIFYFHGSPGTAESFFQPNNAVTGGAVRVSGITRESYGESDPNPGCTVSDVSDDMYRLHMYLNSTPLIRKPGHLPRGVAVARSGGGLYAAAFAARFPELVSELVLLAPVLPDGPLVAEKMGPANTQDRADIPAALQRMEAAARQINDDPHVWVKHLRANGGYAPTDNDSHLLNLKPVCDLFATGHRLAIGGKHGSKGWQNDFVRSLDPSTWGFDYADIRVPVTIIVGAQDRHTPVDVKAVAALFKNAPMLRVVSLDHIGHLGMTVLTPVVFDHIGISHHNTHAQAPHWSTRLGTGNVITQVGTETRQSASTAGMIGAEASMSQSL